MTFYKNELLEIDANSSPPTKIKNMKDASTINLVDTRMDRNTERSVVPDTDRPPRQRKIVKVPVASEPPKITITRSGRQAKPKRMFGEALSDDVHSVPIHVLERQMLLSHQIKMMM